MVMVKEKRTTAPAVLAVMGILELFCLGVLIYALTTGQWLYGLMCLANMVLILAPELLKRWLHLRLSAFFEICLMLFTVAAIVFGTVLDGYYRFDWLDLVVHGFSGFLVAAIGYQLYDIMNPHAIDAPNRAYRIVCAFFISLGVAALWEFWEFFVFTAFDMDMQHDAVLNRLCTSYFTNRDGISDVLENITSTTIVADGKSYVIDGYLDMGFIDTLTDMLACFSGTLLFLAGTLLWKEKFINLCTPRRVHDVRKAQPEMV